MIHTNYKPQKGEQILVHIYNNYEFFNEVRIFSHEENGLFYCFSDSGDLDKPLPPSVSGWKYCKRLNGLFHDDFKSVNKPVNKSKNKLFDSKFY